MLAINHLAGFGAGGGLDNDPYWSNVVLLLHFDGTDGSTTFTDVRGHTVTLNGGAAEIDTAQSKFGGASCLFGGSGSYLTVDHSDIDLGTGDYTVEGQVRYVALGSDLGIFQIYTSALGSTYGDIGLFTQSGGSFGLWSNAGYSVSTSGLIAADQWKHFAVVRNGANVDLYIDGVSVISRAASSLVGRQVLTLGAAYSTTYDHNGWIDEFRITKGVARYTGTFTPPGLAFPES